MSEYGQITQLANDLTEHFQHLKEIDKVVQFEVTPIYDDRAIEVIVQPVICLHSIMVNFTLKKGLGD